MTLEELRVIISAETSGLRRQMNNLNSQIRGVSNQVNRSTSGITNSINRVAKFIGGAFVLKQIASLTRSCTKLASDLQEVQNVVDVTFKTMSASVSKFAQNAASTYGLSETMAKKYVGLFGTMSTQFGFTEKEAYKMATTLTGLSGDVASFYNITQDEAYTKLKSVFSGETETLKDIGIVMTQNALDQYALANGYNKTTSEMTEQEKVALRYNFVLNKLSNAQGDFVRTGDSWANQVRVLKLNLQQLGATIGQGLIVMLTPLVRLLNTIIEKLTTVFKAIGSVAKSVFGIKTKKSNAGISGIANDANIASDNITDIGDSAEKTQKKINGLAGFDEVNTLNSGGSSDSGSGGYSGLGASTNFANIDSNDETNGLASKVEKMANKIKKAIKSISDFIKKHKKIITSAFAGIVAFITSLFVASKWAKITGVIASIISYIELIPTAIGVAFVTISSPAALIAAAIGVVVAAIVYLWQTSDSFRNSLITGWNNLIGALKPYYEAIKNALMLVVDILITVLKPVLVILWDYICTIVDNIVQIIMSFWNNVLAPIVKFIGECVLIIVNALEEIWNFWKPTIEKIGAILVHIWDSYLKPIINWVGSVFIGVFKKVGEYLKPILEGIKNTFKGLINFIVGVFTGDWKRAWEGVKNIFAGIWNTLKGIVSGVWDAILRLFAKGGQIFKGITEAIGNVFKKIVNCLISGINFVIAQPFDFINGILNKIRKIEILGFSPFDGLWDKNPLPVPQIPMLAKGGVVDGATLAMIGEAGKEAVVPLENNIGWMYKVGEIIANSILATNNINSSSTNNTGMGEATMVIDGQAFGRLIYPHINKEKTRIGISAIKIV